MDVTSAKMIVKLSKTSYCHECVGIFLSKQILLYFQALLSHFCCCFVVSKHAMVCNKVIHRSERFGGF